MLAVSVDDLRGAETIAGDLSIPFPILYDPPAETPRAYGVYDLLGDSRAAPATFVVDSDGVVRWKYVGRFIGDRPSAREVLKQLAVAVE